MKVPPKRKGNAGLAAVAYGYTKPLNESPSEKEGKSITGERLDQLVIDPQ